MYLYIMFILLIEKNCFSIVTNIVLYELFDNSTPNFKQPILISIIEDRKYMKINDTGDYFICYKELYICKFGTRIRALINP